MRQLLIAFGSFSRVERLGISAMGFLLMLLIVFRCTLSLWVRPPAPDKVGEERLLAAYRRWKAHEDSLRPASSFHEAQPLAAAAESFEFDPNTLDSNGFIRLGFPVKAVKGLLSWRRKGKRFYKAADLRPLYNLPPETYTRIAPYVRIAGHSIRAAGSNNHYPDVPAIIELNTADSALLDRGINGIGATLARKIVERRRALGGFLKHEQLLEIYRFPDSTFQRLKEKLRIDIRYVVRMNANTVGLSQLSAHPYIGEAVAKNILLYREGVGRYTSVEQLRQVPLMSEEIYRKIAPYFAVE